MDSPQTSRRERIWPQSLHRQGPPSFSWASTDPPTPYLLTTHNFTHPRGKLKTTGSGSLASVCAKSIALGHRGGKGNVKEQEDLRRDEGNDWTSYKSELQGRSDRRRHIMVSASCLTTLTGGKYTSCLNIFELLRPGLGMDRLVSLSPTPRQSTRTFCQQISHGRAATVNSQLQWRVKLWQAHSDCGSSAELISSLGWSMLWNMLHTADMLNPLMKYHKKLMMVFPQQTMSMNFTFHMKPLTCNSVPKHSALLQVFLAHFSSVKISS